MRCAMLMARVASVVGGAVALLALDLVAAPSFKSGQGLLIILSIAVGGLAGDVWWRWKVRYSS
jgi:hypothetical protein